MPLGPFRFFWINFWWGRKFWRKSFPCTSRQFITKELPLQFVPLFFTKLGCRQGMTFSYPHRFFFKWTRGKILKLKNILVSEFLFVSVYLSFSLAILFGVTRFACHTFCNFGGKIVSLDKRKREGQNFIPP